MEEKLSHDNNVCKALESMANYILFADDAEKVRKIEYNFYTPYQMRTKFGKENSKEIPFSELVDKSYNGIVDDNVINFIVEQDYNYKKCKDQEIFKKDLNIPIIRDYEIYKKALHKKSLEIPNKKNKVKRLLCKTMKEVKSDQIYCKDAIKGTVYFKAPLRDTKDIDYDQFDFLDFKHVKALLSCTNSNIITDLGCLVTDMNNILKKIHLKKEEKEVISLIRRNIVQEEIAYHLNCTHQNVKQIIGRICNRVIKMYFKVYEDWYYLNISKGKYKQCSICAEIKLLTNRNFSPDKRNKDGYYSYCKICNRIIKQNLLLHEK